ncbi:ATP-grasp domain-containing protein [Bacillus massilinigeriensis]|uniref:ATP-grasp domain-containing protein n=1 Tax=Bacillus massilionigeriensis TaxID=1805475 RepID=UPI00096B5A9D|nr:ATP-grasp domain-containing protein [Bacillus massilionigeriensis]
MNILFCSAGRRVKLLNYFQEELSKIGGKVVAVDCESSAPALQFADIAETVSPITHPDYLKQIRQLCKKYNIQAIISLIDPELTLLSEHKEEFEKGNIKVIVSDKEIVETCFDKYKTHQILEKNHIPTVPTFIKFRDVMRAIEGDYIKYPLIAKPRTGSASIGISLINTVDELKKIFMENKEIVLQPYIEGEEYGVDCYVDLINQRTTNIFCKKKLGMRAGETDRSIAVYDEELIQLINRVLGKLELIGPIDIDCFKTSKGYLISEINPRFGGGYLHAHSVGQNYVKNIINNMRGIINEPNIGNYIEGSIMIKFDNVMVINSEKSVYL